MPNPTPSAIGSTSFEFDEDEDPDVVLDAPPAEDVVAPAVEAVVEDTKVCVMATVMVTGVLVIESAVVAKSPGSSAV